MNISLKGQKILVTGASRGIGRAIALQLSKSGAEVIIHFNSNSGPAAELQKELPNRAYLAPCDLTKPDQVIGFVPALIEKYGAISGIVNNAGIARSAPDDLDTSEWLKLWEETLAVNSTSLAILCKEFVEHAIKNNQGRIVNISSRAAFRGDTKDYIAYAASKGAVVSLTRTIARHYGKDGIKAFLIAPGFTRTDMADEILSEYGEDFALNDIALNSLTEPQDLAPMVTLLCSGMADHATGATIDINAGSYVH